MSRWWLLALWVNGVLFGAVFGALAVAPSLGMPRPWHLLLWPSLGLSAVLDMAGRARK